MKAIFFVYQWLIALPIVVVITLFTALFTIIFFPFKNAGFVHAVQVIWSKLMIWLFFSNVKVDGVENLTKGQSYVFVANHESAFDTWVIYGWLPVIFKWIMKAELRKIPFVGLACKAAGHIYIERTHLKAAANSIEVAKKTLVDGVSVVIFPEGTRSATGEVGPFKRGAFQIAYDLNLPVVPLSLTGTHDMMPKGAWFIRPFRKLTLVIGKPVDMKQYETVDETDGAALKAARIEGMEEIRKMVIAGKR